MPTRHVMRLALERVPGHWPAAPLPGGAAAEPPGRPAAELAPARVRAYPPGHADWEAGWDAAAELERLMAGEECGVLLPSSRIAVADGAVVGAALLTDDEEGSLVVPPGLLVADVFRDPDPAWRGLGGALLRRALAAAADDGHAAAHLLVTDGNPAQALYARLGFEPLATYTR
jgi:GNAT superfamily N-acetyltransferase